MLHNILMVRYITLLLGALSFFLFAGTAFAQSLGNQPDPIQFLVAPEVPAPGDEVLIEAQGVGTFLGDATITWQINGKTVLSGLGENTYHFTIGGLGSQTSVHIIVSSPTKGTIVKDFTFMPSLVNMLWEARTSVPPWYKGKALYTAGSELAITALPQVIYRGASVPANSLSFQWKRNNKPVTQSSGKGKNIFTFKGDQLLKVESVSVDVQVNGITVGKGSISIPSSAPQVIFYQRDPLRGVLYDNALINSVSLVDKEITLQAEPFYFAKSSLKAGAVPFEWTLNNKTTVGPDTASGILTLRQSGSGAGSASVGVEMQNNESDKFVQSAQAALRILFGTQSSGSVSSFFGL